MRSRLLGRSGMRVSELCLGTMTFGTEWRYGAAADETVARQIYQAFRDAGGNFVDTANMYTAGQSEQIVGRLVAAERDAVVIATKFTLPSDPDDLNSGGSHRKSLRRSVESSLRRLDTDYIDLLWVHAWDQCTALDETLRALDDLIGAGKVLTIGVSNTPAWVIARSQAIAELRGWSAFCAIQIEYSLISRSPERELLPMAHGLDLSALGWSPLGRGLLARKESRPAVAADDDRVRRAVEAAEAVAAELETTMAKVALAWSLCHGVMPVLGASKVAHITDNLGAVQLELDEKHLARLDESTTIDLGYPHHYLQNHAPTLLPHHYQS